LRIALARARAFPPSAAVIAASVALLAAYIARGQGNFKYAPLIVVGPILATVFVNLAKRWPWMVALTAVIVICIPNDGRYTLSAHLPIQMEPYRLIVAIVIVGWLVALLVDPRVRARASKLDRPLALIVFATLGSEFFNAGRVSTVTSYVIKALWLFACLVLLYYIIVSVIRSRATLERLIVVLVSAGCIEAVGAMAQRRSNTNIFDRLHSFLPGFRFNGVLGDTLLQRGGSLRATGAAGHPIELSATMAMLLPLAVYLAVSRGQKRWWVAAVILLGGDFAGGSRTGMLGLLMIGVVCIWLRPRQTLKCWPALIPALVVVHFVSPGALGAIQGAFFPSGGLIRQQSSVFVGRGGVVMDNSRLSRLGPSFQEWSQHNPFFGEGYGTRVTGYLVSGQKNPDDNATVLDDQWLEAVLETGLLGIVGWIWLFGRAIRRLGARAKLERGTREGWLPVALAGSVGSFAISMLTYDAFAFTQATCVLFILLALVSCVLSLPPSKEVTPL
jgi:hypothetical protein